MIDKRLLNMMKGERIYGIYLIILKVIMLLLNIFMIFTVSETVSSIFSSEMTSYRFVFIILGIVLLEIVSIKIMSKLSNLISASVKEKLRIILFDKISSYGMRYSKTFNMGEVVQLSVNAIENLEVYFSSFLPQLVYSLLSALILFIFISGINLKIAIALLAMIPLIPISIIFVQKIAKKINKKYWGSYVELSEIFVDFLEGLTTLIIFNADEKFNKRLNKYAKDFRINTMKVLSMQLNNITVLDIIAYAGASMGIILTVYYYSQSLIDLKEAIIVILISSEFFLPLRLLGSFFHIAMNGMGAIDKLFKILDTPLEKFGNKKISNRESSIEIKNLYFSYKEGREILKDININLKMGQLIYIVGESGCGKSTIASLIMNKLKPSSGQIIYNNSYNVREEDILKNCTLVTNNSYLFKGTLKYNLQMGNKNINDEKMWNILDRLSLKEYFKNENGLDTVIEEKGNNFSGGQKQRIAIARAILKNSPVYIFDEATSNIDSESEDIILDFINEIRKDKLIIMISHRLKYTPVSDHIYYLENGMIKENGRYEDLTKRDGAFKALYDSQTYLESWGFLNE
ncbi:MAG: ABC transporter ATP-binding protein/permease [Peptoniphilaceae bacterium]